MNGLPEIVDFNDADYPDLVHIFHEIDTSIAAIVASDPALRRRKRIRKVLHGAAEQRRAAA